MNPRFIVVDDDSINNIICSHIISRLVNSSAINCFELPAEGLKFISSEYNDDYLLQPTILFLDINMPGISGWDFLDEFAKMSGHIHNQISIYMVSSSVDPSEMEKAKANIFVKDFLEKPLRPDVISNLLTRHKKNSYETTVNFI